ncbi:MAG: hypothetical protein WC587_00750 [Candidatus Paceibacterota bacterium]
MVKLELRMKKDIAKILFVVAVVFTLTLAVHHQSYASPTDFIIEMSPENPGPNENVNAKIITYSFDINRADISWLINGQKKDSGIGKSSFSFKTGEVGSKTTLTVSIITKDGLPASKSIIIRPADVDLLWEAANYVPPTYKGKALPSSESTIKVIAMPNIVSPGGNKILPSNLVYQWEINNKKFPDVSGYGKSSFTFRSSEIFNEDSISITVSDFSQTVVASKRIKIKIESPKIIFYENRPIEGVLYDNALSGETQLGSDEISVKAEPFFFSKRNMGRLNYEWTMNGEKISPDTEPSIVTLRTGGGSGSANIGLRISNLISILQFAEKSLMINYGQ